MAIQMSGLTIGHIPCLWKTLTGFDCAGCGLQRAVAGLLQGEFVAAFRCNYLLLVLVPYLFLLALAYLLSRFYKREALYGLLTGRKTLFALVATVILWAIIRNVLDV